MSPKKKSYRVLVGISYGDKHVEADEVVSDIPAESIDWLLEQGSIEEAK